MIEAPTLLIAALLLASAPRPGPSPETRRHLEQELSADDTRVAAFHEFGDCTVRVAAPGEKPKALLDLVAGGESLAVEAAYLQFVKLAIESRDGVTTVRSLFPDQDKKPPKLSINASLTLVLPESRTLEVENRYGKVSIAGAFGEVLVRNQMGAVQVSGVRGAVRIFDDNSDVVARDCAGDVVVEAKNCEVTLERIGGLARAHTTYRPVRIDHAGSADIETSNLSVELSAIEHDAKVVAPRCNVTARKIGGSLTITGQNAPIEVEEVGGNVSIQQSFRKVEVRRVRGGVTIAGSLADTAVEDAEGSVDVRCLTSLVRIVRPGGKVIAENSGRQLEIVDPRGDVQATANGGLLKLRAAKLPADGQEHEITLVANGGAIELVLPEDGSYALEAKSSVGQIECALTGMDITPQGTARVGSLRRGDGKVKLHATCVGGAIRVVPAGPK
jgi:DUF4097 and DUF4098 domain-containing protein YvlB